MKYVFKKSPHSRLTAMKWAFVVVASMTSLITSRSAMAERVVTFYLGSNASPDTVINYDFNLGHGMQTETVSWDGETFDMPPFFGTRITWWQEDNPNWGLAIDNVHAKVAANPMPSDFAVLEFTDGVNMVTGNVHYRHLNNSLFTPYVGVGVGFTTPHVEVLPDPTTYPGGSFTNRYQFGGASAQILAGIDYKISDRWSVFGEAKYAKFWIRADLDGGGSISTDIPSRQIAFGVNRTLDQR